ncbi:MAG: type IIL restriction-modification enzyme MmeI, partial [Eggerthellaceae bacterium]
PQMRQALIGLFKVLDTPDGKNGTKNERDPYLDESLAAFPYVNGGLFAGGGRGYPAIHRADAARPRGECLDLL